MKPSISMVIAPYVREWVARGHSIDDKLLVECAYYPRGGCQHCSWNRPNPHCKWSHILVDTRIDPFHPSPTPTNPTPSKGKTDGQPHFKAWGIDLSSLMKKVPKSMREEMERIIRESESQAKQSESLSDTDPTH